MNFDSPYHCQCKSPLTLAICSTDQEDPKVQGGKDLPLLQHIELNFGVSL